MFLKEFSISRYGPLAASGIKKMGNFNLFFGSNEEGKTLTIDALLRLLLGKGAKSFQAIKRVDEFPEGFLVLENEAGSEIKLPGAGTVQTTLKISPAEFSNIFIIRDSDLSISNENTFYRDITNRLTGLRSGDIENIKSVLHDLGSITTGGDYQNIAPDKLKNNLIRARDIIDRIDILISELQEEDFSIFDQQLAGLKREISESGERISLLRAAQSRELYEKGKKALSFIRKAFTELNNLSAYTTEELALWQKAEADIEHNLKDIARVKDKISDQKESIKLAQAEVGHRKASYRKIELLSAAASEAIEPKLARYEEENNLLREKETLTGSLYFKLAISFSAAAFLISLAGSLINASWWVMVIAGLALLSTALLAWGKFSFLKMKSKAEITGAQLLSAAEKINFPADSIQSIRGSFGRITGELSLKKEQLNDAEKELDWQREKEKELNEELEDRRKSIRFCEEEISLIRHKSGLDNLEQYSEKLDKKDFLCREIGKQESILESHFGKTAEDAAPEEKISFWQTRVAAYEQYSEAAAGTSYDQIESEKLAVKKEKMEKQAEQLAEKLREREDQLRFIEKEVSELPISGDDGVFPCQTIVDLEEVRGKLSKWVAGYEEKREYALIALEIFTQIGQEEEKKVAKLFGLSSPISLYFRQITGGRYTEVIFDNQGNRIRVICDDGKELDALQLSGGTYDQLYFSIRLALGEKILDTEKGFFILDDPFIKADYSRLKKLLQMLLEINQTGWQVLYFSAKSEVKEILQKNIAGGDVRVFSIT